LLWIRYLRILSILTNPMTCVILDAKFPKAAYIMRRISECQTIPVFGCRSGGTALRPGGPKVQRHPAQPFKRHKAAGTGTWCSDFFAREGPSVSWLDAGR